MAELKQFDVGLGPLSYFQYPCGHHFYQIQDCPVCEDERHLKLILDQGAAYGTQIEKQKQVLRECQEFLDRLASEGEASAFGAIKKLYDFQSKIDEVLR